MLIKRSELWRQQYRNRRYLQYVNDKDLEQRLRDITCNFFVLYENGKIGPRHVNKGESYWIEVFTHILEEYSLRGTGLPPNVLKEARLPKATYPAIPKSVAAVEGRILDPGRFLIKYGKTQYLKQMLNEGFIRISPTSKYNDSSLNTAIKDDELTMTVYGLPSETTMQVIDKETNKPIGDPLKAIGNISYTNTFPTDYYVYCTANVYDHRLFQDFEADSCVIINNPSVFKELLEQSIKKIHPEWLMFNGIVEYFDPFNTKGSEYVIPFAKHFRYAYQYEYRFAWVPPPGKIFNLLPFIELNLGSLRGIAELIVLE